MRSPIEESVLSAIRPVPAGRITSRKLQHGSWAPLQGRGSRLVSMIVGSVARGTFIHGDRDLDIFLLFDPSSPGRSCKIRGSSSPGALPRIWLNGALREVCGAPLHQCDHRRIRCGSRPLFPGGIGVGDTISSRSDPVSHPVYLCTDHPSRGRRVAGKTVCKGGRGLRI